MSDNIGKKLREKNLAKFDGVKERLSSSIQNNQTPELPDFGSELNRESAVQRAGKSFSQDGMYESPFKHDHFNSKFLGFDLGEVTDSAYNENGFINPLNTTIDFDAIRADNQSAVSKFGSLATQFVGKTLVGTVGNLIGGIYGIGEAIATDKEIEETIFDNEFYQMLDRTNEAIELKNTIFVNSNDGIGFNANTAKGLNDAFTFIASAIVAESVMQTAGNLAGGTGILTAAGRVLRYNKQVGKMMRLFEKSDDVTRGIRNAEELQKKAQQLGKTVDEMSKMKNTSDMIRAATGATLTTARRALTTTGYEASLEARGVKDEFTQKAVADLEYVISRMGMSEGEAQAYREKKMKEIEAKANTAALSTFAINTGLLSISNAMQFPQIFGNSFTKGAAIGGVTRKGLMEVGQKEGKKAALSRTIGTVGKVLKNPATEFMEETMQGVASEFSKNYFEVMLGDQTSAGILKPRAVEIGESLVHAIKETYGTEAGRHEGIIGAIVGGIGIPGLKKHGKGIKMHGGMLGSYREIQEQRKEAQRSLTAINSMKPSEIVKYNRDNAIRSAVDSQNEDIANIQGNKVAFDSVRDNKIFRYTTDRLEKGMEDFIKEDVNEMREMATNNIEKYRKVFQKEDGFTSEDAVKEVDAFVEKVDVYRDAYNKVHRHFNLNLMRTDDTTKKLTDTLVYAVATEKIYMPRLEALKQKLYDLSKGEFSKEEIDEFVKGTAKYGDLQTKLDKFTEKRNAKRGIMSEETFNTSKAEIEARKKAELDELGNVDQSTIDAVDHKYNEELAELEKDYNLGKKVTPVNINRTKEGQEIQQEIKEYLEQANKDIDSKISKAMKEISRPGEKATVKEMTDYLARRKRIAELMGKQLDNQSIFDQVEEGHATPEEMMQEVGEITDRLVTATNVAAHLYGFKNDPNKLYNKILTSQFWADLDNAEVMGENLDNLMNYGGKPDAEFKAGYDEFKDVVDHVVESFDKLSPMLKDKFPEAVYDEIKADIEALKEKLKKYQKFQNITEQRDKQEKDANKNSKKKEETKPTVVDADTEALNKKLDKNSKKNGAKDPEEKDPETTGDGDGGSGAGTNGGSNKGSKNKRAKIKRAEKYNSLSIREQSKFPQSKELAGLVSSGKIKERSAVTLNLHDESQFDANTNSGLKESLLQAGDIEVLTEHIEKTIESIVEPTEKHPYFQITDPSTNETTRHPVPKGETVTKEDLIKTIRNAAEAEIKLVKKGSSGEHTRILDSYQRGLAKVKADPKELSGKFAKDLHPDVYTFVRFAPMHLNIYDTPLSEENDFDFDLEEVGKKEPLYHQKFFFAADDVLNAEKESALRYAEYQEELDKIIEEETAELKTLGRDTQLRTKRRASYAKRKEDLYAKFHASANNGFTNFDFRHRLLRHKYLANEPKNAIKLKVQTVDFGDLQKYAFEDNEVEEFAPSTLGFDPMTMTLDDIWYGAQNGEYRRFDGKKASELTVNPFADLGKTALSGAVYFAYKTKSGKIMPVQMNMSKLDLKHVKILMDVMEDYWNHPEPQSFKIKKPVGIGPIDSRIKKKIGGITMKEFTEFFMKKQMGPTKDTMNLKNVFNLIEKEDGQVVMYIKSGESSQIEIHNKEEWHQKKSLVSERLAYNRFSINKDFIVETDADGENGKLLNENLKYYFDNKLISHSFDVSKNFDGIFSKHKRGSVSPENPNGVPYNKGIVISRAETKYEPTEFKRGEKYVSILKELRDKMGGRNDYDKWEVDLQSISDDVINSIIEEMHKSKKALTDKDPSKAAFTDEQYAEILDMAVETVVNRKLSYINDAVERKPQMLKGVDHETVFKIQKGDSPFDGFLRMMHGLKKHGKEATGFRNALIAESKLWGSKQTLKNAFANPGTTPIMVNSYANDQERKAHNPQSHINSKEKFYAMKDVLLRLNELILKDGKWADYHITYSDDFYKSYGPKQWDVVSQVGRGDKENRHKGQFKTKLHQVIVKDDPRWDDETGKIVGGSIYLQVGTIQKVKNEKTGEMEDKVKRQMLTLFQESDTEYPDQNIVRGIRLPFINSDFSVDMEAFEALEADIKERGRIRANNSVYTHNKVRNMLGEDFLKVQPDKPMPGTEPSHGHLFDTSGKKENEGDKHPNDQTTARALDEAEYLDDTRVNNAKLIERHINAYNKNQLSETAQEKSRDFIKSKLDLQNADEFIQIFSMYKTKGKIDKDLKIDTFAKALFPVEVDANGRCK